VGITSSDVKNAVLVDRLGFAAAVNRASDDFRDGLRAACPEGVDVYVDHVGGEVSNAVLPHLVHRARIVQVGVTAGYDTVRATPLPADLALQAVTRSLRLEGFLVGDFTDRWPVALRELQAMAARGDVAVLEDIHEGLQAAPSALVAMMSGGNLGQVAVRVRPEPPDWPVG
jgi:NADPH-dependent curcumin reductase CurA